MDQLNHCIVSRHTFTAVKCIPFRLNRLSGNADDA